MRIALILLSILAMIFIGSVTWSLIGQEWWIPKTRSSVQSVDSITIETWKNQIKTDEKIEKLSTMVEELSKGIPSSSVKNNTQWEPKEIEPVKISGKLLATLLPTITPTLIGNSWIFGLLIFDQSIGYSTYRDDTYGITLLAMNIPYDIFLKNIKALSGTPYTINEVTTFPTRSFYLNPAKSDTLVRLAIEMESQTIAIEITKTKFSVFKNLLLGKTSQGSRTPIKK